LWLHSLKVAQLLRSAACLHTNQSRSYLNHLVVSCLSARRSFLKFGIGDLWKFVQKLQEWLNYAPLHMQTDVR